MRSHNRRQRGEFMAREYPQHSASGAVNAVARRPRLPLVAVLMVVLLLMQAACSTAAQHNAAPSRSTASVQVDPQKGRSEEHTSELQSLRHLVCRLLLE